MGNIEKPNIKKYEISVQKRLLKIIEDTIKEEKKENQINHLINQNIEKRNQSNFSKNFHENPYENICSILNLIYVNNTNSILKNSLYESMFNYDINDEKEQGSNKVKERINELIPDFLGDKTENEKIIDEKEKLSSKGSSKGIERINKLTPDVLDNKSENEKINAFEKVNSDSNCYLNENQINKIEESSERNFEKIKKKKHSKNPKHPPEIAINLNLKDIEKEVHLEKIYEEKKKKQKDNSNLKKNLTQININDKKNLSDKNFLKIFDSFIQPNKLEKDKIHNLKKRKIKNKK